MKALMNILRVEELHVSYSSFYTFLRGQSSSQKEYVCFDFQKTSFVRYLLGRELQGKWDHIFQKKLLKWFLRGDYVDE